MIVVSPNWKCKQRPKIQDENCIAMEQDVYIVKVGMAVVQSTCITIRREYLSHSGLALPVSVKLAVHQKGFTSVYTAHARFNPRSRSTISLQSRKKQGPRATKGHKYNVRYADDDTDSDPRLGDLIEKKQKKI
jgi:hypothetical protein